MHSCNTGKVCISLLTCGGAFFHLTSLTREGCTPVIGAERSVRCTAIVVYYYLDRQRESWAFI